MPQCVPQYRAAENQVGQRQLTSRRRPDRVKIRRRHQKRVARRQAVGFAIDLVPSQAVEHDGPFIEFMPVQRKRLNQSLPVEPDGQRPGKELGVQQAAGRTHQGWAASSAASLKRA
jgi:hypothetical protein